MTYPLLRLSSIHTSNFHMPFDFEAAVRYVSEYVYPLEIKEIRNISRLSYDIHSDSEASHV